MTDDIFKGQWKQVRGRAKEWWGNLTDDDLDTIDGKREQLVGKLQEKYDVFQGQARHQRASQRLEKAIQKHV